MRLRLTIVLLLYALASSALSSAQAPDASAFETHVVKPGETLFRIALAYNFFAEQVAAANGISDMNSIRIGQQLIIPIITEGMSERLTHVVGAGESLASIAAAYSLSQSELLSLNSLASAEAIQAGAELVIVAGSPEASVAPVGIRASQPASSDSISSASALPEPSGQALLAPGDAMPAFTHSVASGDTLSDISLRYDQSLNALIQANNILDPGVLRVGQRLVIPGLQMPRLVAELPPVVSQVTMEPLVLESGRSARIDILTAQPARLRGQFLGRALRIISDAQGKRHLALIAIPMFTATSVYPLSVEVDYGDGESSSLAANLQVIGGGYGYQNITIGNSDLLARDVEAAELALLVEATRPFTDQRHWQGTLALPAASAMNAVFGTLRSYNGSGYDRYHTGVDFAGAPGTSVLAAAPGLVARVEQLQIRGNTTIIDHGWGLYTVYAHQRDTLVQPGSIVSAGQVIGTIGSTGRSTGPHLHWELWLNGVNVDPLQWTRQVFA